MMIQIILMCGSSMHDILYVEPMCSQFNAEVMGWLGLSAGTLGNVPSSLMLHEIPVIFVIACNYHIW